MSRFYTQYLQIRNIAPSQGLHVPEQEQFLAVQSLSRKPKVKDNILQSMHAKTIINTEQYKIQDTFK